MNRESRDLIFQAIDQTISAEDFDRLQDLIEHDEEVRTEYIRAVNLNESIRDIAASEPSSRDVSDPSPVSRSRSPVSRSRWDMRSPGLLATAATILALVGGAAFWFGQSKAPEPSAQLATQKTQTEEQTESLIAGHATLRRAVDLQWPKDADAYHEGDLIPDGVLKFQDGLAEIDFFCGATLIVEGPATLDVQSDWSVRLVSGRLRANVPPAARGFIVKAAGSEIIDLGTEFALEVSSENARVEVIDGEVKVQGGEHDGNHLVTGQRRWLKGTDQPESMEGLSTLDDVQRRREDAAAQRIADWKTSVQKLSTDNRLIAYYPIAATRVDRVIRDTASTSSDRDGTLVGPVNRTAGRFGTESTGLEFDRPGSRVRTRIDGEFESLTFACWVKIDNLEHVYNSLFMSDGYENGELHWQIRNDGRLMFSVMVDDAQVISVQSKHEKKAVQDAGLHRVYFTEPFWDLSKSGRWFHLAAVYDPANRMVKQYVNGQPFSSEPIVDKFYIDTLRIGPSEIGNWGQPFRQSPWFAVRNLNGTIDELAIFHAALDSTEIFRLYEQGKPLGY